MRIKFYIHIVYYVRYVFSLIEKSNMITTAQKHWANKHCHENARKKNVDFYPRHFRSEFIPFVVITFSLLILIAGCFMFVAHLPQINLLLINCTEACWNRFLLHSFRTFRHPHYSIRRGADRIASITIYRRNDFRFTHKSNQDDFQCHFPPKMPLTFFVFMYHVMFAAG